MERRSFFKVVAATAVVGFGSGLVGCGSGDENTTGLGHGVALTPGQNDPVPGVIFNFYGWEPEILEDLAPYLAQRNFRALLSVDPELYTPDGGVRELNPTVLYRLTDHYGWEAGVYAGALANESAMEFGHRIDDLLRSLVANSIEYPTTVTQPVIYADSAKSNELRWRFQHLLRPGAAERIRTARYDRVGELSQMLLPRSVVDKDLDAHVERIKHFMQSSAQQGEVGVVNFSFTQEQNKSSTEEYIGAVKRVIDYAFKSGLPVGVPRMLAPANIVVDPGFNRFPIQGWGTKLAYPWGHSPDEGGWVRTTEGVGTGIAALYLGRHERGRVAVSQSVPLKAGQKYRVTALVKIAQIDGKFLIQLRDFAPDNISAVPLVTPIEVTTATNEYVQFEGQFVAENLPQTAVLDIAAEGTDFEVWVDNVSVVELTSAIDPTDDAATIDAESEAEN